MDQFRGDGIASRGAGYGIPIMRVDGNDFLAVHEATRKAREFILKEGRPVLIEAMTYRQGHHSTSDDSTRYREVAEIKHWKETCDPIDRTRNYLIVSCIPSAALAYLPASRMTRRLLLLSVRETGKCVWC